MFNEVLRRIRGRVRQSRKIMVSEMNSQVDYAIDLIRTQLVTSQIAQRSTSDSFELLILSSTHDLPLAFRNIEHMRKLYGSTLLQSTVIAQEYPRFEVPSGIKVVTDGELLWNPKIINCLNKFGSRASWMRQQYLKSYMVHAARNPVLILDADTFLVKAISWHSSGSQLLLINTSDYHIPYTTHASNFLGIAMPALNFVSHVQLQTPNVIREIYSSDFDSGWKSWAESSRNFGEDSPASEFQTYGGFVVSKYRNQSSLFIPDHQLIDGKHLTLDRFMENLEKVESDLLTIGNKNEMQL